MRISVNLATLSSAAERYALAWAVPLALFGIFGLATLCYSALSNFHDYQSISVKVKDQLRQEQDLKDKEAALRKDLDRPPERELFHKAQFVNGLIEQRQLSVTDMTKVVSKLLPSSVRLTALAVARPKSDIVVRFSVEGHDEDGLETFVGNLEDSPDFKDLAVSNQGPQRAAAAEASEDEFGIVCSARYVGSGAH